MLLIVNSDMLGNSLDLKHFMWRVDMEILSQLSSFSNTKQMSALGIMYATTQIPYFLVSLCGVQNNSSVAQLLEITSCSTA